MSSLRKKEEAGFKFLSSTLDQEDNFFRDKHTLQFHEFHFSYVFRIEI